MTKNENIDATFNIEEEDLGNWVVSLMEEFIKNEDLNDYMFSSLPEDYKLSDEQAEIIASVSMNSFLAGSGKRCSCGALLGMYGCVKEVEND